MKPDLDLGAVKAAFQRELLGIEQVDAVIGEDGGTIMLYGYTADPDATYVATFSLPAVEWRKA